MSPYDIINAHLARHPDLDAVMLLGSLIEALCDYHAHGRRGYGFHDPTDADPAGLNTWTVTHEIKCLRRSLRRDRLGDPGVPASILEALHLGMDCIARDNAERAQYPDACRSNRYISDTTTLRTRADLARCQMLVKSILARCMIEVEHEALEDRISDDERFAQPPEP